MDTDMQKKGMISIIIPVYNSKERLVECLESVAVQSYENLEVIIVDDCSTDGSLEICREYEKKYSFIRVYTKENEGVSAARNFGLAKAKGEFIQFADSDDMLYPEACSILAGCMEKNSSDVVICGYYNEKEQKKNVYDKRLFETREEFMKEFPVLFTNFFIHVPWNKLYRRSVVKEFFPEDLDKGEDLVFNLRVFENANKISVVNDALYFYHNINDNSLSFRFRENAMQIEERLFREVADFYTGQCKDREPVFLYHFYMTAIKNKFYSLMGRSGFGRAECKKCMREWSELESVRELYKKKGYFGKKDRMFLFFMRRKMLSILYWYYRR